MTRRLAMALAAATSMLLATACSVDVQRTVSAEELEKKVQEKAGEAQMPPGATIDCADDLKAEVDANTTCWWRYADDQKMPNGSDMPEGTRLGTTVSVRSTDGGEVQLDIANHDYLTLTDGSTLRPDAQASGSDGDTPPKTSDAEATGDAAASTMPAEQVETKVTEALASQIPAGSTVDCPDDLVGESGATTRCWWSYAPGLKLPNGATMPDGTRIGTTVTVTSAEGSELQLNAKNDEFLTMSDGSTKAPEELSP